MMDQTLDFSEKVFNEKAKLVLQEQKNLEGLTNSSGQTLLHLSVKSEDVEITQSLINVGCNTNAQDHSGMTPLMMAIMSEKVELVETLLKNNADIYLADNEGKSSVQIAFYQLFQFSDNRLIISYTLDERSHLVLKMVFDKLNNDFINDPLGMKQLIMNTNDYVKLAMVAFGNGPIAKFILENYSSIIDLRDLEWGRTALHYSIILANLENTKMLIKHGANIDAIDEHGCTPLSYYLMNFEDVDEQSEVLKIFLRRSKSLSAVTKSKGCPIHDHHSHHENLRYLMISGKEKTIRVVLQSGIDVNARLKQDGHGLMTSLIRNRKLTNYNFLNELNIKYDLNEVVQGMTPLMCAIVTPLFKLNQIESLLQLGADPNLSTELELTPLAMASPAYSIFMKQESEEEMKKAKLIELLIQYGADTQSHYAQSPYLLMQSISSPIIKVTIAHWAMLAALDKPTLTDISRFLIESMQHLKHYFNICTRQLDQMKRYNLHGTITLFKVLTEKEEAVATHFRSSKMVSEWINKIEKLTCLQFYYLNILKRKLSKILEEVKLREKALLAFDLLTGMCSDVYYNIVHQIIDYLDHQDLNNLCQIESIRYKRFRAASD